MVGGICDEPEGAAAHTYINLCRLLQVFCVCEISNKLDLIFRRKATFHICVHSSVRFNSKLSQCLSHLGAPI